MNMSASRQGTEEKGGRGGEKSEGEERLKEYKCQKKRRRRRIKLKIRIMRKRKITG